MPLLKRLNLGREASVIIWKTEESQDYFLDQIKLHPSDRTKLEKLKHPEKKREFLALRCCLKNYFGENPEVLYRDTGKPYLNQPEKISFSHTKGFAGMVISKYHEVGIDLEVFRKSIRRIAPKYMRSEEFKTIDAEVDVQELIHYWGAKEVMVKITGNRRLHFRENLRVAPFYYRPFQDTTGLILNHELQKKVKLYFKTIGELHISFGWEI